MTGFGLIDAQGSRSVYVASGCIRTAAQADLAGKLVEIFAGVTEIIQQYNPSEMAIEKVFMAKSAASALKLGHARGVRSLRGQSWASMYLNTRREKLSRLWWVRVRPIKARFSIWFRHC